MAKHISELDHITRETTNKYIIIEEKYRAVAALVVLDAMKVRTEDLIRHRHKQSIMIAARGDFRKDEFNQIEIIYQDETEINLRTLQNVEYSYGIMFTFPALLGQEEVQYLMNSLINAYTTIAEQVQWPTGNPDAFTTNQLDNALIHIIKLADKYGLKGCKRTHQIKNKELDQYNLKTNDHVGALVRYQDKFALLVDSELKDITGDPKANKHIKKELEELIKTKRARKKGDRYILEADMIYKDPNIAASLVAGQPVDGWRAWKNQAGQPLGDLQEEVF